MLLSAFSKYNRLKIKNQLLFINNKTMEDTDNESLNLDNNKTGQKSGYKNTILAIGIVALVIGVFLILLAIGIWIYNYFHYRNKVNPPTFKPTTAANASNGLNSFNIYVAQSSATTITAPSLNSSAGCVTIRDDNYVDYVIQNSSNSVTLGITLGLLYVTIGSPICTVSPTGFTLIGISLAPGATISSDQLQLSNGTYPTLYYNAAVQLGLGLFYIVGNPSNPLNQIDNSTQYLLINYTGSGSATVSVQTKT